jgi:flagellar biosynthesis component FlhA
VWLLNACNALDFITSEHPKAMSVLSAILITVGSIPAIPAISAGAGGAVLASGAAHAIGVIAVGVGQALNMSVKNSEQRQQSQADSNSRAIMNQ